MASESRRTYLLVGCAWVVVVLSAVAVVRATEASAKADLSTRTELRASVGARFVASYIDELVRRERAQADALLTGATVSQEQFDDAVRSLGFQAAVLLDGAGRALHVHPPSPALVGVDLAAQYDHLRLAVAGRRAISVVVPSAVAGEPLVAFALPFETATGRRVFSGGFHPSATPLAAFLENATPITPNRAAIVDTRGGIVATNRVGESATRVAVSDQLLQAALADDKQSSVVHQGGTAFHVVDHAVEGTPWRMALAVPTKALYSPLRTGTLVTRGLAAIVSLAALVIGGLIVRLSARSRDAAVARDAALLATEHKSRFLAHMSHEIRNPINGVVGMTEMLLETDLDPTQREYAEIARSSAVHLQGIVDDVLDFSKIEADKVDLDIAAFSVRNLMQEVADSFRVAAGHKSLSLTVRVDDDVPPRVRGDYVRVRQVLTNLVGNAVKFTEQGFVALTAAASGDLVRFEIIDSGIGMTDEAASRVFEPFAQADTSTTRRYGGTGLGLTITKRLTELMGGACGVTSSLGRGSEFWLEIPLPAVTEPDESAAVPVVVAAARGRILVADDNQTNQRVAAAMLESAGFQVDVVGDGAAALAALEHATFDVVLMDCHMPIMDGLEATARLRAREAGGTRTPVIALTGTASLEYRDQCMEAGMDGFIAKPVNKGDLLTAISRVITPV